MTLILLLRRAEFGATLPIYHCDLDFIAALYRSRCDGVDLAAVVALCQTYFDGAILSRCRTNPASTTLVLLLRQRCTNSLQLRRPYCDYDADFAVASPIKFLSIRTG